MKIVRCVDNEGVEEYLTVGNVYRVLEDGIVFLTVMCDRGTESDFEKSRFIVMKPVPKKSKPNSIESIANEIGKLVQEKNDAYGSSFARSGEFLKLLYPDGIKPDQYGDMLLVVRIFDKQMRIANKKGAFGESPYRDITGYGILGALVDEDLK